MRILFHSLTLPYPANNGYKMRTWSLLQALAAEGHEITLVCFATPQEAAEDTGPLSGVCRFVEIVPREMASMSSALDFIGRLRALAGRLPYGVTRFRSGRMRRRLAGHLQIGAADLIFTETSYSLINFPAACGVPLVLDNHNVEHQLLEHYIRHTRSPLHRAYARIERGRMRRWDAGACARASVVLTCSEHDRNLLLELCPTARFAVVPNTLDLELYASAPPSSEPTILYVGGMDWYPNRDAAHFFAEKILPQVRRQFPQARFVVAGRNPSASFRRVLSRFPGVELTGAVPDMRAVIAEAAVCVVPLRIGSGTRLKILEAGAMAKAMVSTRLGAEGLDFAQGNEILLADEPRAFSDAVIGILSDPARRHALGAAARRRVEEKYSFPVLRRTLRQALSDISRPLSFESAENLAEAAWERAER